MKTFYAQEPHLDGTTLYQPGDKREADENEVKHLVELNVLGDKPPESTPDYERDSLKTADLSKASKAQLLVIAAYEGADAPKGDAHTDAELRKVIETKRKAA
ncbi:hypothetical protein U1707_10180 [Sphingomonas sp. PB2P12]|uniref:hypothetical protein n=1 Tax=Sphingomonas sandaracina TaxID=3096157 RepID=UPI002FC93B0A